MTFYNVQASIFVIKNFLYVLFECSWKYSIKSMFQFFFFLSFWCDSTEGIKKGLAGNTKVCNEYLVMKLQRRIIKRNTDLFNKWCINFCEKHEHKYYCQHYYIIVFNWKVYRKLVPISNATPILKHQCDLFL